MEHKHSLLKSFKFAIDGVIRVFVQERNFKIQVFTGLVAVIMGFVLKIKLTEWFNLIIVITLVLIFELINTSIEEIVDLISPEYKEAAKIAKDVAAGTVLVAAIGSVAVGTLLFLPKIMALF